MYGAIITKRKKVGSAWWIKQGFFLCLQSTCFDAISYEFRKLRHTEDTTFYKATSIKCVGTRDKNTKKRIKRKKESEK